MTCDYCNSPIPPHEINFAKNNQQDGYFCEVCEYFHYFDVDKQRPQYKLFLERSANQNDVKILKKPAIQLKKRLSPLRYPGGKSRLIDFIYHEVVKTNKKTLYSPFAGGASVELALLDAGVVDQVVLNDLDDHLMNFYQITCQFTNQLIHQIETRPMSAQLYEQAHRIVNTDYKELANEPREELAFYYLINNRCSFSGIYKGGRMGGKNGTLDQLTARWNPKNIVARLKKLRTLSSSIALSKEPYEDFIEEYAWDSDGVFLIDPPYIEKAAGLYRHRFQMADHQTLFLYLSTFWHSFPSSDFFVFYDDHPALHDLAIPDDVEILARKFSIANH